MAVTSAGLHAHESHRPHPTTGRIEMLSRKATMATHAEADLARIAGEQQLKHAAAEKVTPTPILAPALALEPTVSGEQPLMHAPVARSSHLNSQARANALQPHLSHS